MSASSQFLNKYSIYIDDGTNDNYTHNYISSISSHIGSVAITLSLAGHDYYQYKLSLGGVVWWGNGVTGGDRTNNVEGVRIALAPAATYTVRVAGHDVSHDYTEGGAAALYMRGAFREGLTITFR